LPISSIRTFSHLGICVSDLDKAMRFYCEGLGFKHIVTFPVGNEAGKTMEIADDIVLDSVIIRRDGVSIELLGFKSPKPKPVAGRRSMTQVGLTHLSLLVDDVEAVAAHAVAHGGTLVPETRTVSPAGDFIFVLDPDGTRVELMRLNAGPVPTGE
jgi:catechol 2,3-dioxygenase-like lactoylglutathione lyase family enzyme